MDMESPMTRQLGKSVDGSNSGPGLQQMSLPIEHPNCVGENGAGQHDEGQNVVVFPH
jgi:hypothetical protein